MKANVIIFSKTEKAESNISKFGQCYLLSKTIKSKRGKFLILIKNIKNDNSMLINPCGDKDYIVKFQ